MINYCQIAEIKEVGRLNITSSQYDATLSMLVETASRWIDRYMGVRPHTFAPEEEKTLYFNSNQTFGRYLRMGESLLTLTSVTNGDASSISLANIRLHPRNEEFSWQLELDTSVNWSTSFDGDIAVTGKWGYSAYPPIIVAECTRMLASWLFKRYQAALQDATANYDLGEVIYGEAVPKPVTALLEPLLQEIKYWRAYCG